MLDEPVVYASIPAWDGQIGVAPMRAPLLVKMDDGPLRLDGAGGKAQWFFVAGGFGQMNDNRLTLLTDEAIGIDQMMIMMQTESIPHEQVMESIELFGKYVIPEFKKSEEVAASAAS